MRGVRTFLSVGPFWWTTLQFPNTQIHKYTNTQPYKFTNTNTVKIGNVWRCALASQLDLSHPSIGQPFAVLFMEVSLTVGPFWWTTLQFPNSQIHTFHEQPVHGRKLHQKGFSDSRFHEQTTAKGCNIQQRRNTQKAPGVCNCVSPVLNIISQAIQDQSCQVLKPIIKIGFLWINFCKMKSKSKLDTNWEVASMQDGWWRRWKRWRMWRRRRRRRCKTIVVGGWGDKHAGWMVELPTSGTLFRSTLLCIQLILCAFFGRNTVYKDNLQIQFANTVYKYNLQKLAEHSSAPHPLWCFRLLHSRPTLGSSAVTAQ